MLAVDNIRRLADRFAEAGIRLALEPECFLQSVERLRRMLRDVGDDRVFVNFDPTNFYLGGSDPLEIFEDFDRRILSGHIKDAVYRSERRDEVPVGEGELDYDRILSHLLRRGAPMTLFIEHCTTPEQVRAAARHIAAVLERLGRGPAAGPASD